MSANN